MSAAKRGNAVLRADGGDDIGAGHVIRCLALMEGLIGDGWRAHLAVNEAALRFLKRTSPDRIRVVSAGEASWDGLRKFWPEGCDLLVLDHYKIGRDFESKARRWAKRIVTIDDIPVRPHDCDILIDQTAHRSASSYENLVNADTLMLCGSAYSLLRSEFAALRHASACKRHAPGSTNQIRLIVAFGGGEKGALLSRVATALVEQGYSGFVDIIAASEREKAQIDHLFRPLSERRTVHVDPPNFAELMANADVALGAGGTSAWERACLGLPTLLIQTADNQRDVIGTLVQVGAAEFLGNAHDVELTDLVARIEDNAMQSERYEDKVRSAHRLCDGLGVRRVAQAIKPERATDGRKVFLRPAQEDDCDQMFYWQNQAEMRRFLRNPNVPTLAEHRAWFLRSLGDPSRLLNVILAGNAPAGVLRLDRRPQEGAPSCWEIGFLVDVGMRGLGIGTSALRLAHRLLPEARLIGEVFDENIASRRAFENAGFRRDRSAYVMEPAFKHEAARS